MECGLLVVVFFDFFLSFSSLFLFGFSSCKTSHPYFFPLLLFSKVPLFFFSF